MSDKKAEATRHETLAAALAAFQAELPTVEKGSTAKVATKSGPGYSFEYADLADVSARVLPVLGRHGLAWMTRPTMSDGAFNLVYELRHESGETVEGVYPLPPGNTPAQQLGGAITYARRYALCAVTGVAPGGDEHDAPAPGRPPAPEVELPDDFPERIEALASPEEARALWSEGEAAGWLDASAKAAITARVTDLRAGDA